MLILSKRLIEAASERAERLVNVMDAYVLGAVAPYNMLLGGKLVASLIRTREIRDVFRKRYKGSSGIISGQKKDPHLLLVTTTSALGRSSVYNRLRLGGIDYFRSIGFTIGSGHFHVPHDLFEDIRLYLTLNRHSYSKGNRYGDGPNWKFRAIRAALEMMNVRRDFLQHGIKREVFACPLATNAIEMLRGQAQTPDYTDLYSVAEVSRLALERWIYPRAQRAPSFLEWKRDRMSELLAISD